MSGRGKYFRLNYFAFPREQEPLYCRKLRNRFYCKDSALLQILPQSHV